MFILEERCVPKCSSIVTATKICQAASQEPGTTQKEMGSKLEAIFMKAESSFLSQSPEAAESTLQYSISIL